jgi:hypothetical protein
VILSDFLRDCRSVLRQAWRAPGFVLTAAATLALGIGANTGIFSIINGFQRPLPVVDPDRIVVVAGVMPGDDTGLRYRFSFPAIEDYRRLATAFSDVFAFDVRISGSAWMANRRSSCIRSSLEISSRRSASRRSWGSSCAGRRRARQCRVGDRARSQLLDVPFGGDPGVVGRSVKFDGQPARIVGVAPAGSAD